MLLQTYSKHLALDKMTDFKEFVLNLIDKRKRFSSRTEYVLK